METIGTIATWLGAGVAFLFIALVVIGFLYQILAIPIAILATILTAITGVIYLLIKLVVNAVRGFIEVVTTPRQS